MNYQNIKKNNKKKENLSIALRKNLKLRKKQIIDREDKNIKGKRLKKIGFSSLIHSKNNNE